MATDGISRSALAGLVTTRNLGVEVTARNWRTVTKLLEPGGGVRRSAQPEGARAAYEARVTKDAGAPTLELTRWLPAQPPAVFAAFSQAEEPASWWGPVGFTVPSVDFDPRAGATYRDRDAAPGESFHLVGEFRAVDPPTHLAYLFLWEPPGPDDVESVVDLRFRDVEWVYRGRVH